MPKMESERRRPILRGWGSRIPAHLVALFQPDADEAHEVLNLRQSILHLRQALGSDAETHLHAAVDLVRLDLSDALLVSLASGHSQVITR